MGMCGMSRAVNAHAVLVPAVFALCALGERAVATKHGVKMYYVCWFVHARAEFLVKMDYVRVCGCRRTPGVQKT